MAARAWLHLPVSQLRLDELNPPRTRSAIESRGLDLARADAGDMELRNRVLWRSIKGANAVVPPAVRSAFVRRPSAADGDDPDDRR